MRRLNKFALFVLFVSLRMVVSAQDSDLVSRHRPGMLWYYAGIKAPDLDKVRRYDRLVFDVLYCDWTGKDNKPFKVSPLSIGMNVNGMFDLPLTKFNTVSFGWGFSYGIFRIKMNDFFVRNESTQSTKLTEDIDTYGIEKSIFKVHTVAIPLEIRFRGKNWKHAKLQIGGRIGYNFMATTVLGTKHDGIDYLQKTRGFYDLNPINAQAHIRFGIRNWSLYASYSFLPLFKSSESTQLNTIQMGLSISVF